MNALWLVASVFPWSPVLWWCREVPLSAGGTMWRERLIVILIIPADMPNHQDHPRAPRPRWAFRWLYPRAPHPGWAFRVISGEVRRITTQLSPFHLAESWQNPCLLVSRHHGWGWFYVSVLHKCDRNNICNFKAPRRWRLELLPDVCLYTSPLCEFGKPSAFCSRCWLNNIYLYRASNSEGFVYTENTYVFCILHFSKKFYNYHLAFTLKCPSERHRAGTMTHITYLRARKVDNDFLNNSPGRSHLVKTGNLVFWVQCLRFYYSSLGVELALFMKNQETHLASVVSTLRLQMCARAEAEKTKTAQRSVPIDLWACWSCKW